MALGIADSCPNALHGLPSEMFLTVINTLMAMKCELGPEGRYPPNFGPFLKDEDEFDFIVVGAGSAGCIVANRLSEVPHWKVLLLEAGDYPSALTEIPSLGRSLLGTNEDWQYKTEPSKTCCLSLKNGKCPCPRGKGLGGSSLLNTMLYTRSTRYDHERWFNQGNEGWDYDSIEKHYKKHENAHIDDNVEFGNNGELHLTRYTNSIPIERTLIEAYQELGYDNYTESKPVGFRNTLTTIYQGTRMSTSKAFLAPIKNRTNLLMALNAHVSKLLIDRVTLSVQGVQVKIDDKIINLRSKKEVVLSAGSINTPSILMHSGIGPKEHLGDLKIDVVKDLKVGENLQDHFSFAFFVSINESSPTSKNSRVDEFQEFLMHRTGDLSKSSVSNLLASLSTHGKNYSNVQYFHRYISQNNQKSLESYMSIKRMTADQSLMKLNQKYSLVLFAPIVLHPKSRGFVRVKDSNPFGKPLIFPNYLNDEHGEDIQVLVDSIKIVQKLIRTRAFAPYEPNIVKFDVADCETYEDQSDDFWKCLIRHTGSTSYHPTGTCKMGPANDTTAVVNPKLQVHGVKGVRVMDGSIMPAITSGNPNAPIIMIGEKGAALIKEDWTKKNVV